MAKRRPFEATKTEIAFEKPREKPFTEDQLDKILEKLIPQPHHVPPKNFDARKEIVEATEWFLAYQKREYPTDRQRLDQLTWLRDWGQEGELLLEINPEVTTRAGINPFDLEGIQEKAFNLSMKAKVELLRIGKGRKRYHPARKNYFRRLAWIFEQATGGWAGQRNVDYFTGEPYGDFFNFVWEIMMVLGMQPWSRGALDAEIYRSLKE